MLGVELPGGEYALVGRRRPQHVEHRGRHAALGRRPPRCRARDGVEERVAPVPIHGGERGVLEGRRRDRERREIGEQLRGDLAEVAELETLELDAGFLEEALQYRRTKLPLRREVTVDGPLAHSRPPADRAEGEAAPVPGREAVHELRPAGDDALARLGRLLAPESAVVAALRGGFPRALLRSSCPLHRAGRVAGSTNRPGTHLLLTRVRRVCFSCS